MTTTDAMTCAEASRVLGLSMRQVQRLADGGRIAVIGHVGRTALLDTRSVLQLRQVGIARGRAWNEATIWSAIALLDGEADVGIGDASRRWHLRERLRQLAAEELVRLGVHRACVVRYRASAVQVSKIGKHLALAGVSALDYDVGVAETFGLAQSDSDGIDGYLAAERAAELVQRFFLTEDQRGNVTLRLTEGRRGNGRVASITTVALDLAESLDTRQRAAGLEVLRRELAGL